MIAIRGSRHLDCCSWARRAAGSLAVHHHDPVTAPVQILPGDLDGLVHLGVQHEGTIDVGPARDVQAADRYWVVGSGAEAHLVRVTSEAIHAGAAEGERKIGAVVLHGPSGPIYNGGPPSVGPGVAVRPRSVDTQGCELGVAQLVPLQAQGESSSPPRIPWMPCQTSTPALPSVWASHRRQILSVGHHLQMQVPHGVRYRNPP
mmetsp:Transcript_36248/g.87215  ORF Transcript_36248/g.87215 Transcript_36248/m.87215 type:complete len:203 (+) Transcript_36248:930-1538(+)